VRLFGRLAAGLLLLAALAGGLLLLAAPASAHAVVISSDPPDGTRLSRSPDSVTIRFDEPVGLDPGYLRVVDATGQRVDTGTPGHPNSDGAEIEVTLRPGLADGSYLASYRVISADSHPVAGSIRYVVGDGPLVTPAGASGSGGSHPEVFTALAISHWLSFAGIAVVGGSWLIFTIWPYGRYRPDVRRLIWTGWLAAVAGAAGEFLVQGPYAAGDRLSAVFTGSLMDATLHANTGQLLSVRLVLIGVLGFVLSALFAEQSRLNWAPELAAMVGVGLVVSYAAAGHSESVDPRWLAVLVVSLHLAAMIVWLGGLCLLLTVTVTRWRAERAGWLAKPAPELAAVPAGLAAVPADRVVIAAELDLGDAELAGDWPADDGDAELAGDWPADDGDAELSAGLPIFSRVALICVCTLLATGLLQAWHEIRTVDAIATTRYGQLVLIKVVLFAGLVLLGRLARRRLRSPAGESALARLRRTLGIEVAVGAIVLAATGVLVSEPPGTVALAAHRAQARQTTVAVTAQSNAVVEVDPGVHGSVQFSIRLTGGIKPTAVTATASLPAKQLGPIPLKLQATGPASYTASGVLLPSAGTWQLQITVQTSEFDSTTAVAKVKVY
jgi:copper transport protein